MGLQLAPQFHDMKLQRVGYSIVALIPDVLVNPGARQHLARVSQEEDEKRLFFSGQIEPLACPLGAVGREVDANIRCAQDGGRRGPLPARPVHRTRASSSS